MKTHGQGSIVKLEKDKSNARCRKWQIRVSIGKNPYTGKYETKTRRVSGTYTNAIEALDLFKNELSSYAYTNADRSKMAFIDYANMYTKLRMEGKTGVNAAEVSINTINKDKWNFNAVAREIGGDTPLSKITPAMLETMFINMRSGSGNSKKKLSGTYTHTIYVALNNMFTYASKNGDIAFNPLENVECPKEDTKPKRALPKAKMAQFISQLDPTDRMEFAITMIVCCGLRRSEIAYSTFSGINFEESYIEVRKSKTKSGLRTIPLTTDAMEAIKARLSVLKPDMETLGVTIDKDTSLLSDATGNGVTPHYIGAWWQKNRNRFDLDGWTLHELRHSFVSLLGSSGAAIKVMQDLSGHASASTTIDIYTHTNLEAKREAMQQAFDYLHDKNH